MTDQAHMTIQDLDACVRYRRDIAGVEESIARLRSEMERVTQVMTLAPGRAGLRDKLSAQVAQLQELEAERAGRIVAMEQHVDQCKAWLATLPEQQATILWLRHGEGLSWEEVAKTSHYSVGHCRNIHVVATRNLLHKMTSEGAKIVL